jgi:hypothetical protein
MTPTDVRLTDATTNEDPTMQALRLLLPSWRLWLRRDASSTRRALRIWMATGSVPVAHMVAELDWTTEFPTSDTRQRTSR